MKSFRLVLLLMAGCCFLRSETASAQGVVPAYAFPKQFSADQIVTTKDGTTLTIKMNMDNGKIRSEIDRSGLQIVSIVRPDQQKMYAVLATQKMVMVTPLDPAILKQMEPPGSGGNDKVETVGPDMVDGVAATKYKITSGEGKVFFLWVDTARQSPVKIASEDGAITMLWKNFQAGPQDTALFEPPTGYQIINMPDALSMPPPGGGR